MKIIWDDRAYKMLANHDVEISEKQVEQGNVKDAREALNQMKVKYFGDQI